VKRFHRPMLLPAVALLPAMIAACSLVGEDPAVSYPAGELDTTFDPAGGPGDNSVDCIAVQADGKVLIGGGFASFDGDTDVKYLARLGENGGLDAGFVTGLNATVSAIAVQADGKVLVCGNFTFNSGTQYNHLLRLDAAGAVDPAFNIGSGVNSGTDGWVRSLALQTDGKVLIGGWFSTYIGENRNKIARVASNGVLDTSFANPAGTVSSIETIAVQADGKVVVGGVFSTIAGADRPNLARLKADGTLDAGFDPGAAIGTAVNACAVQSDGGVLIGGNFVTVHGESRKYVARLNTDGSLDDSFNGGVETGANNQVWAIAQQADGKIIIAGDFTVYNGVGVNYLARLNPDGSLDSTFDTGSGPDDSVWALAWQSFPGEKRLLIGGAFTHFDGQAISRIARLK